MEYVESVEVHWGHWKQWLHRFFLFLASVRGADSKQCGQE